MGIVSEEVQTKRIAGVLIFMMAIVLGIPLIGLLFGFFLLPFLGAKIYAKSSTRLNDFGILLAISVAYLVVLATTLLGWSLFTIGVLQFIVAWIGLKILLPRINPLWQ